MKCLRMEIFTITPRWQCGVLILPFLMCFYVRQLNRTTWFMSIGIRMNPPPLRGAYFYIESILLHRVVCFVISIHIIIKIKLQSVACTCTISIVSVSLVPRTRQNIEYFTQNKVAYRVFYPEQGRIPSILPRTRSNTEYFTT